MSLKKIEKLTRKFFEKEMKGLSDNEYELDDDSFVITNSGITLNGHDDDIYMRVSCSEMRGKIPYQVLISFTFDKLDRTLENFELLNKFNASKPYFTANITDKNYFKLQWHFTVCSEDEFVLCLSEALATVGGMSDDPLLKEITSRTV